MSFANVLAVFSGQRFALDGMGSAALWFVFTDTAVDLEITPDHFYLRLPGFNDLDYDVASAAGVLSFLLADAIDARSIRTRILPTKVQGGSAPVFTCPARHVLAEAFTSHVVVRVRANADALDTAIPTISEKTYLRLSHACPHCHEVPDRYRELSADCLVCMSCGASSDRPRSR